ncbi:hypothetical protein [Candidatus Nitrosocosmicus franklandus]|uniref:Uncharacterized protein n=1 Tax=Candidatus Nitrosocosmicus franklandianus TaxID=1798806 RepID=A0A484IEX4_9ARCH|nr:hypothetical protein [Candidatus Nitrosocosmicus franklandus]VFJ14689.1 protein of unknown function [Candidatus Nitrosocosmicus franklandus]
MSSDILLITVFVQMGIIAILILTTFLKLNKINLESSSPSIKNTEYDKKLEKRLTAIQIRLSDILTEISTTTKEQKEALSKMVSSVAGGAVDAGIINPGHIAHTAANTSLINSAITGNTKTVPYVNSSSYFTLPNSHAFISLATLGSFASTTASVIYNNSTGFTSSHFDERGDRNSTGSESLNVDLERDNEVAHDTLNGNSDNQDSKLQYQGDDNFSIGDRHTVTDSPSSISNTTVSSISNAHHVDSPHIPEINTSHNYYPLAHDYLKLRQGSDKHAPSEQSSEFQSVDQNIKRNNSDINSYGGEEGGGGEDDHLLRNQNYSQTDNKGLHSATRENNSNPELDKIDKEILNALQRLGGIDELTHKDDDNNNSSNSNTSVT